MNEEQKARFAVFEARVKALATMPWETMEWVCELVRDLEREQARSNELLNQAAAVVGFLRTSLSASNDAGEGLLRENDRLMLANKKFHADIALLSQKIDSLDGRIQNVVMSPSKVEH